MPDDKPSITRTQHELPFDRISPRDFERLCTALLPRVAFENPKHYGAAGGEQGRDIVARHDGKRWYVQCKRVKRCGPKVLLDEIKKVCVLAKKHPESRPAGILFMVACDVSATARDRAERLCAKLGLSCEVWGGSDLDIRLQPHEDILSKFFDLGPAVAQRPTYETARPAEVDAETLAAAEARLAELPLDSIPPITSLPPGSRMPLSPNPLFVGRETNLKKLAATLKGG